ncbi:hypothetical protein CNR27_11845 [Luteimonas chenhongjianii]|uniref:Uncharacterized protein n=1 Tax=Luteimonas chenhongjianii TaxID=2006110 RepID=A0A290XGH0_9GAMM|nr:hypothetical protein [Luteimonas chenhongjianii]ATD68036.1 hypothetical protein CNR27_11845 [Luteimonas chenhongjianii]
MSKNHAPPGPNSDKPPRTANVGVNDRKASKADDYAHDNNRSAEGNDASLTSGPAFERRVHADGSVSGAPPEIDDETSGEVNAEQGKSAATPARKGPAGAS